MNDEKQICVMDDERNCSLIGDFLSRANCRVKQCTTYGATCEEEGVFPDVILLNAQDDEAALKKIEAVRERASLRQVPIIAYDSTKDPSRKETFLRHGASDYLAAPIRKSELLERIRLHTYYMSQLRSFDRFVPEVYMHLMKKRDLASVSVGDFSVLPLSVLFTDMRSFTEISEKLAPEDIFRFLNSLFSRMEPIVKANHGFIDNYIGDAMLALFPENADDCLSAGVEMLTALDVYNRHRATSGYAPIEMGLGLHFGNVALGTIGSDARMNATVIGDSVNLAQRVESLTKVFGVNLIITSSIYHRLSDPGRYHLREIDTVRVKGKQETVVLYEAYGTDPEDVIEKKEMMMDDYLKGLALYKQGDFQGAMNLFTTCKDYCDTDKIPDIYIRRCNSLIRIPPGKDWAGVTTL